MSHNPSLDLDKLCENVRNNIDLLGFSHIDSENLIKVEKNQVEEVIYAMMSNFKKAPLEIANSIPKLLYERVEQKWHYYFNLERKISETSLAQVLLELSKA